MEDPTRDKPEFTHLRGLSAESWLYREPFPTTCETLRLSRNDIAFIGSQLDRRATTSAQRHRFCASFKVLVRL